MQGAANIGMGASAASAQAMMDAERMRQQAWRDRHQIQASSYQPGTGGFMGGLMNTGLQVGGAMLAGPAGAAAGGSLGNAMQSGAGWGGGGYYNPYGLGGPGAAPGYSGGMIF